MVFVVPCSLFVYCRVLLLAGVVLLLFRVPCFLLVVLVFCRLCLVVVVSLLLLFNVLCSAFVVR